MTTPSPFDLSGLASDLRPAAAWASALLLSLARSERAGRLPPRLTEPSHATWTRFRGRLTASDFVAILLEDASVLHPIPFSAAALGVPFRPDRLPEHLCSTWLSAILSAPAPSPDGSDGPDYIVDQARRLGLTSRLARSDLHVVKSHQRVLELPGTGGQLSHHLATTHRDLSLQDTFTVACATWQELTLAALAGLDLNAPPAAFVHAVDPASLRNPDHPLRARSFDFVIGLSPDKGGLFRVEDQLSIWFPSARIVLV
jgi:hypothetical protein